MSQNATKSANGAPPPLTPSRAESRFVQVGKLMLHYLDYGTEGLPPMLCIHGGAAHAHWYDFVAPGFTPDFHVRSLDLRGHGDSDWADPPDYAFADYASDVAAVAEKLDLRNFVLVGHSMGGMVSLVYAARHPGRVARLVIVDTTMHMSEATIARLREMGTRASSSYESHEELITRYRLLPAGTHSAAPDVIRHVAHHSGRKIADGDWRHKFDRGLYSIFERLDGIPLWSDVRIPAVLMKGERSKRVTDEIFAAIKARAPQVELAEVPDSDHHVTLDNPAGFVHAVRDFLSRHAQERLLRAP
ncbi:MAG: alpha/beta fold hydrolase [Burkholderiales bacterium]